MKRTRVIARWDLANGVKWNVLQRRVLWFWIDVELEEVPTWAWIQAATLGSTEWKSPLLARYFARSPAPSVEPPALAA